MKYVSATFKYVFGHFFRLTAISVLPSLFVAFFMQAYGMGLVFPATEAEHATTFPEIFFLVFGRSVLTKWPYLIPVGAILLLVCLSCLTGMVEKHFKTGKLSIRMPLSNINNCFLPVFEIFAIMAVIYVAYKTLLTCVLLLISFIMVSAGAGGVWISVVMAIFSVASFFVLLLLIRPILMSTAIMLVYGYSLKESFGVALKNVGANRLGVDIGLIAPFVPYLAVSALMVILGANRIVYAIVLAAMNTLLIPYIVVFALGTMFDISGIERRDTRRPY